MGNGLFDYAEAHPEQAQAAQRRETKVQDFIDKTRRQLNRQLKSCQSLQKTLEAALNDLAIMDDHDILK